MIRRQIKEDHEYSHLLNFFFILVRLKLGLFEQDLADHLGISQSTVSRIFNIWINFLYLQFKNIPLWPPKELVLLNMPKCLGRDIPAQELLWMLQKFSLSNQQLQNYNNCIFKIQKS